MYINEPQQSSDEDNIYDDDAEVVSKVNDQNNKSEDLSTKSHWPQSGSAIIEKKEMFLLTLAISDSNKITIDKTSDKQIEINKSNWD